MELSLHEEADRHTVLQRGFTCDVEGTVLTYGHKVFGLVGDRFEVVRVECLRVVGCCELDSRDRRWIDMYRQLAKVG